MHFTKDNIEDFAYGDYDPKTWKFEEEEIVGTSRWSIQYSAVFQHLPTGKYYMVYWDLGATEMQEHHFEEQDAVEVQPVSKTVIVFEAVK